MVVTRETDFHKIDSDSTRMKVKLESEREIMVPEREKPKKIKDKKKQSTVEEDTTVKEMLRVDEQYLPLLALLEQFSPDEDGIQFNRKLCNFETAMSLMCPDEIRLHKVFATFRAAALLNSETARKLAVVGASLTRRQLYPLRGALLNVVMQETFSKLQPGALERANPMFLINATNLMGDYFAEARLCNGKKVHCLASPLLQYMRALLGSDDIRAHRCLATQLMRNGRELLSVVAEELDKLSTSIRLCLLSSPPMRTIWLLVSADLCLNQFLPLPHILQQFYAAHVVPTTDENFSEVNCGSWKKSAEEDDNRPRTSEIAEKFSANLSTISRNNNEDTKPKQALTVSEDTFGTCTAKDYFKKRHDVNTWRQQEEEKKDEIIYNQAVLTPNVQSVPVPEYPPPKHNKQWNWPSQKSNGNVSKDEILAKSYLRKRFDLNTWRQQGAERNEVEYKQAVLRPNVQSVPVPDSLHPAYNEQRKWTNQKSKDYVCELEEKENYKDRSTDLNSWREQQKEKKEEIECIQTVLPLNVQAFPVSDYPPPEYNKQRDWASQQSKNNVTVDEEKNKYKDLSSSNSNRTVLPPFVKIWPPPNWTPPPPRPVIWEPLERTIKRREDIKYWNKVYGIE